MEGPIKENEEEKQGVVSGEEFVFAKKQWRYKTVAWVVIVAAITAIIASAITYYNVAKDEEFEQLDSTISNTMNEIADSEATSVEASETVSEINEVLSYLAEFIDSNYIGDIDEEEIVNSTIKGFVNGIGDEYSEYMTAEEWENYQASALGNYVGVGIYMSTDDNGNIVVVQAIKGTPAESAGIQAEDIITAVDRRIN